MPVRAEQEYLQHDVGRLDVWAWVCHLPESGIGCGQQSEQLYPITRSMLREPCSCGSPCSAVSREYPLSSGCWLAAQKGEFFDFCSPNLQGHALKGGQVLAFPSYYKSSQKLVGVNIGPCMPHSYCLHQHGDNHVDAAACSGSRLRTQDFAMRCYSLTHISIAVLASTLHKTVMRFRH